MYVICACVSVCVCVCVFCENYENQDTVHVRMYVLVDSGYESRGVTVNGVQHRSV